MLDFGQVQQRGMQRAIAIAQGGDPPSHTYIIEPIIHQLLGPDYCAGNGAMLTPNEAQGIGSLLGQMTMVMDVLEMEKAQAVIGHEEAVEEIHALSARIARFERGQRIAGWLLVLVVALAAQVLIAWLL